MILGHEKIISDLKRLAKSGSLSHGYIFFGSAMIGKRLVAWSFANFLEGGSFSFAEGGSASGGEASTILQDAVLIHPDEKGTLGIDAIRQLKNFLWQKPVISKYRTVVVDRAELLTQEAQNALLKIAEEPPASTLLILVTSDIESLPATLRSRLYGIYFSDVPKKSTKDLAAGKPGLAARLASDKKLQAYLKSADTLLKSPRDKKKDFIKKILEDEDFNLNEFLDAIILKIAPEAKTKSQFWHKLLKLRGEAAYFNLNPRLQLDNLTRDL